MASLLALIQSQLSPNCPGTAVEFLIAADPANGGPVLVGGASSIGGPLTETNYAYELTPSSPPRMFATNCMTLSVSCGAAPPTGRKNS